MPGVPCYSFVRNDQQGVLLQAAACRSGLANGRTTPGKDFHSLPEPRGGETVFEAGSAVLGAVAVLLREEASAATQSHPVEITVTSQFGH